jgi:hypothetical protein
LSTPYLPALRNGTWAGHLRRPSPYFVRRSERLV